MSCGAGCRHGLDPVWLCLWRRPASAAPIRPLAWEPPYVTGVSLEKAKKKTKKKRKVMKGGLGVPQWCRLSIWHCHYCGSGCCSGAGSIPGPELLCALGEVKRKKGGLPLRNSESRIFMQVSDRRTEKTAAFSMRGICSILWPHRCVVPHHRESYGSPFHIIHSGSHVEFWKSMLKSL